MKTLRCSGSLLRRCKGSSGVGSVLQGTGLWGSGPHEHNLRVRTLPVDISKAQLCRNLGLLEDHCP